MGTNRNQLAPHVDHFFSVPLFAMKSKGFKIQATDDTIRRLSQQSDDLGSSISPNGIASIATFEISKVPASHFWHAIGAIRSFTTEEKPAAKPAKTPPALLS